MHRDPRDLPEVTELFGELARKLWKEAVLALQVKNKLETSK